MVQGIVGAVLFVAGLGLAFFMPLAVFAILVLAVPAGILYGFYRALRHKESFGLAPQNKVLIIDDDIDSALVTADAFTSAGWKTEIATTPAMALDYLFYGDPSLVVLDWVLSPVLNGRDLLHSAAQIFSGERESKTITEPPAPVPVVSLSSSPIQAIVYEENRFYKHTESWQKPYCFEELVSAADRIARCGTAAV